MPDFDWIDITDTDRLVENHQYLLCVDASAIGEFNWRMAIGTWYKKGSSTVVFESNGAPHRFFIAEDGFYCVNNLNPKNTGALYQANGVRYWADVPLPENSPLETLTYT